ncbi:MAG: fibrobacter succinogenes major paralogous domain-containing protein [Muribaculaceae bacterium]|nr:fibrobacter succinogenes major paralogous domain-containing protein [Muribaculaceae bacterium]
MNKFFIKTPGAFALLAILSSVSCTDRNDPADTGGVGVDGTVRFAFRGIPAQDSSDEATEMLSQVNVYHFKGEDFFLRTDIEDPYAEGISLPTNGTTRVYCVSGTDLNPETGIKEADFLNSTVTCNQGSEKSPMFYSGSIDFSEENLSNRRVDIDMKRGVARIDFANTVDPDILITKILVEDAPAKSFIFPCGSMPDESTVSFSREFAEPFYGTETGMFQIFESTRPVNIRVIGEYGDTPINILTTIPAVERNKVYTLQITNISSNVTGAFTCKDWEEGKTTGAIPSTSRGIFIDRLNSMIPEGVEVDYGRNTVTVPYAGANNMKLAFLADTKVSLVSVEGEISTAKIKANDPVKVEEGYISSFNVSIDPNKRLAYSVLLNLKDERGRYNFVEIKVLDDKTRTIETVEIAGATWMAFNCTGPDLSKQVYPVDGLSIEETYINNWLGAIGNLYQFGRQYAYVPYMGYNPCNDLGGQKQDMPWVNYTHMPCPEGYHVATLDEFRKLCPNGTTIPGTYKAGNGESITVTIHAVDGTIQTPTNVGGQIRYMKFTSNDTGNVLILPIAGYKGDKSTTANPVFGRNAVYWTNNCQGCWGGHARAFRFMFEGGESCKMEEFQWPMEAFAYVRAIKNVESNE